MGICSRVKRRKAHKRRVVIIRVGLEGRKEAKVRLVGMRFSDGR